MNIIYVHHGNRVTVREDLKGRHREYCLCWQCTQFLPADRSKNCRIAELLFAVDRAHGIVTPVWECPDFQEKP